MPLQHTTCRNALCKEYPLLIIIIMEEVIRGTPYQYHKWRKSYTNPGTHTQVPPSVKVHALGYKPYQGRGASHPFRFWMGSCPSIFVLNTLVLIFLLGASPYFVIPSRQAGRSIAKLRRRAPREAEKGSAISFTPLSFPEALLCTLGLCVVRYCGNGDGALPNNEINKRGRFLSLHRECFNQLIFLA